MDEQPRRGPLTLAYRIAGISLAILLVTTMATGWLYLLRAGVAHWPGPRVADALPLDELPGTDSVPLLGYLAVFAVAGALLGLVARAVRLNRLTAALSLAAGTGLWLLAVPTRSACSWSGRCPPARRCGTRSGCSRSTSRPALAGAGGALLGRSGPGRRTAPRLLPAGAIGGLIDLCPALSDLVSALVPERFARASSSRRARCCSSRPGMLLLISSRGLARRQPARLAAGRRAARPVRAAATCSADPTTPPRSSPA